jgi:uncharacterized protein (DUF1697 family)
MSELRTLLTAAGYADVSTVLASGNVALRATGQSVQSVETAVSKVVKDGFGHDVTCLVRTRTQLRQVIEQNPFESVSKDNSRLMAYFLQHSLDPAKLAESDPVALDPHRIVIGNNVIYQWCPDGVSKAVPLSPFVERRFKIAVTARNFNTVNKVAALLDGWDD